MCFLSIGREIQISHGDVAGELFHSVKRLQYRYDLSMLYKKNRINGQQRQKKNANIASSFLFSAERLIRAANEYTAHHTLTDGDIQHGIMPCGRLRPT